MMIYLDHNATTPVAPEALEAMLPFLRESFGNASSQHRLGRQARTAVEQARAQVARVINAKPEEIVFTAGATESNNLALQGVMASRGEQQRHLVTSQIEHPSVLEPCKRLQKQGCSATFLPVDPQGLIDPEAARAAITDQTALVSLMHANNEVGTVQPIEAVGAICKERRVLFHVDAVQSFGTLPIDVRAMRIDLLSLSAHKIYGPKGVGALYVRADTPLKPLLQGGHQEEGMRPGTENVPGIVGLGKAAELALADREARAARVGALRDTLWTALQQRVDGARRNGHPEHALPGTLSLSVDGLDGEALVLMLDQEGICISTGSACSSGRITPSHALFAMGLDAALVGGTLRLSLGRGTTAAEIDRVIEVLPVMVKRLRALGSASADMARQRGPKI